ncbi:MULTISPECIES: hypothetical protein [Brevibacterium]|uniref:VanZ family protein n=1 Tax=Brevibacterium salitolerans TaxID=1403566 RepID=A0ABN2WMW9_9MICO|nr:hypothetical protein [Brevibacterium sp.]
MSIAQQEKREEDTCSLERAEALVNPADAGPRDARPLWAILLLLCLAVQLTGLYSPSDSGPAPFPHSDKVFHAAAFAAVTATALLAGIRMRWVLALNAAHAIASELIQGFFLDARTGDPLDVLADLVGIGLGVAAVAVLRRLLSRLSRSRGARSR